MTLGEVELLKRRSENLYNSLFLKRLWQERKYFPGANVEEAEYQIAQYNKMIAEQEEKLLDLIIKYATRYKEG